jgi:hypothetical protein
MKDLRKPLFLAVIFTTIFVSVLFVSFPSPLPSEEVTVIRLPLPKSETSTLTLGTATTAISRIERDLSAIQKTLEDRRAKEIEGYARRNGWDKKLPTKVKDPILYDEWKDLRAKGKVYGTP